MTDLVVPPKTSARAGWRLHCLPFVPVLTLLLLGVTILLLPAPPPAPVVVNDTQPPHEWQPGRLRVGVDAGYPPFASLVDGQFQGHDIEVARLLAAHLGLTVEFINIPYDGLYDALRVSRIDIIISALPVTPEFDGTVIYSRPYFQAGEVLIVPTGSTLRQRSDLPGRVVGAELGSLGDQTARQLLRDDADFTLRSDFDSTAAALTALRSGQIEALIADRVTALTITQDDPRLTIVNIQLSDFPYVIAMPFDQPDLAAQVNDWLTAIERDGTLALLARDHFKGTP